MEHINLAFSGAFFIILLPIVLLVIASLWRIFEKAGEPGWGCIIPVYNCIIQLKIVHKPWWWLLLMLIPYIGIIWTIWAVNLLCKSFGKTEAFTVGVLFLPFIFLPILAFSDATYQEEKLYS